MRANILDAVLAPAAMVAEKYIGTTDGGGDYGNGRSDGKYWSGCSGGGFWPSGGVMVVVAMAAVVEVLVRQAVMEACVLLPLQSWCGGTGTGGSATGISQQPWYLVWVVAMHGGIRADDGMTGIKVRAQAVR